MGPKKWHTFKVIEEDEGHESKKRQSTIGLTLGSGAARGWAHIGILRALADKGIHPEIVCGCSMGALVGGFYAALKLDDLEEASHSLSKMGMLRMMGRLIFRGGFFDNKGIMQWLQDVLGDVKIEELPVKFGAVSVDLSTGMEIWMTSGDLVEAIMASISAPGMLMPFQKNGLLLGDGALANPVPVSLCRALGGDIVIAVDLNAERVGRYFGPHWGLPKTNEANSLEEDEAKMPHLWKYCRFKPDYSDETDEASRSRSARYPDITQGTEHPHVGI